MDITPPDAQKTKHRAPELHFLPAADQWPNSFEIPVSTARVDARAQLGLPIDSPIVASGHQPIVFHPGIVSKLIALDSLAQKTGSHPVWIVPDQDVVDPALIRLPSGSGKNLTVNEYRLGGNEPLQTPAAWCPPIRIKPDLPTELESIGSWISGYEHEETLARQFSSAVIGMLCEQLGIEEPTILFASDLMKDSTTVGQEFLDAMLSDPLRSINAYNTAVNRHPNAGIRPLAVADDWIELPFWRLDTDSRSEVFVDPNNTESFDRSRLVPRGLSMTAIMRQHLCDFFIHGTGGFDYDQITTEWIQVWLGQSLAPIAGISADLYLELDLPQILKQIPSTKRAVWRAHHARHTPSMLGDESASETKARLVESIHHAKAQGDRKEASSLFSQLQSMLRQMRHEHSAKLDSFDHEVKDARSMQRFGDLSRDRTWAFPLYRDQQLLELKASIVDALGASC